MQGCKRLSNRLFESVLGQKSIKGAAEPFNGLGGFDKFQGLVRDFHHELVDVEDVGLGFWD